MKTYTKSLFLILLWIGCTCQLQAQSNAKIKLGKASEVKAKFAGNAKGKQKNNGRVQVRQEVPGQSPLVLNLKNRKKEGTADVFFGEVENTKGGTFYLKIAGNDVSGSIIMRDQKKYYDYSSSKDGAVYLTEQDIDKVLCVEYQQGPEQISTSGTSASMEVTAVTQLESLPGAEAVVLLDFDGQVVTNTLWNSSFNSGEPIVAAPAYLSEEEMVEVWKMMSEDFRPFELNVTTNEEVYNNAPANRRTRVIFTPTRHFYPNAGGVAYIGSFTWGNDTPCWVFNSTAKYAGEAGSHEVGHTLRLFHDGRTSPPETYYYGHDSWGPIMGAGYYREVTQWSKGEYPDANNMEDDLQKITTLNGFGYRTDDHGDSESHATLLLIDENGSVSGSVNKGVISTQTDVDVFSFRTSGGAITLNVDPDPSHPNLDILLTLKNSSGTTIATADPSTLAASLKETLAAGTYYLEIDGVMGNFGANSDYSSLGQYFISGNVPTNVSPVVRLVSPKSDQRFTAPATIQIAADASDTDGSISRVEFFDGTIKLGEDLEAPYTYTWSGVAEGTYTLTARAIDNLGAATTSAPVAVTVLHNVPPVVRITSPGDGHTLTIPQNPIQIIAAASDEGGSVTKVEFFNGTSKLGEDSTSPYTYSWRQPHIGTYYITAVATDNMGAKSTSDVVAVTVVKPGKGNLKKREAKAALAAATIDEELTEPVVYPNPATPGNMVMVKLPAYDSEASIVLHELGSGKKLFERTYSQTQVVQLDISGLPRGLYSITVVTEGKTWTKKLVVLP